MNILFLRSSLLILWNILSSLKYWTKNEISLIGLITILILLLKLFALVCELSQSV